ncbi:radical SAM protein [Crossiella sp. CA198]|uniref:radical SAM protein n=1 Tax=Crossiella sp. CA198 TaxID=3455607 RepID=UPI003F8CF692
MQHLEFAWFEVTGKCQLECEHCYADSGPKGTNGTMRPEDWTRVIDEVAQLGGRMVQFIGGEPALHPGLPEMVNQARGRGLEVEVFSNLVHVPPQLWNVLAQPGVRLATSYYSDRPGEHAAITRRRGSHPRTKANIIEALRRSIPLRVGLIDVRDGQRVEQARAELAELGVTDIGVDHLRQVGRGVRDRTPSMDQLCGHCARGQVAISPDGSVWPCVFSRWMPVGNVRMHSLADILTSPTMAEATQTLEAHFATRATSGLCDPKCGPSCGPACRPHCWPTGNGPCTPKGGCQPNYDA